MNVCTYAIHYYSFDCDATFVSCCAYVRMFKIIIKTKTDSFFFEWHRNAYNIHSYPSLCNKSIITITIYFTLFTRHTL